MNVVFLWRTSKKLKEPNIDIFDAELYLLLFRLVFLLLVLLFVMLLTFIFGMDGTSLRSKSLIVLSVSDKLFGVSSGSVWFNIERSESKILAEIIMKDDIMKSGTDLSMLNQTEPDETPNNLSDTDKTIRDLDLNEVPSIPKMNVSNITNNNTNKRKTRRKRRR
jgi:hypothetical protein